MTLNFLFAVGAAQSLPVAPPSEGGPGTEEGSDLSVSVTASTTNCILGSRFDLLASATGGSPPYSYSWEKSCTNGLPEAIAQMPNAPAHLLTECAGKVGTFTYKVTVTDSSGATADDSIAVTIYGPDQLQPTSSVNSVSSPYPVMKVLHKFKLYKANGNEIVGECFDGPAYERIWEKLQNGQWQNDPDPLDPNSWEHVGQDQTLSPNFFYDNGYIWDYKTDAGYTNWDQWPENHLIREYKQQVAVRIPKCPGVDGKTSILVTSPVLHFKVKKVKWVDGNGVVKWGVKHEIQ